MLEMEISIYKQTGKYILLKRILQNYVVNDALQFLMLVEPLCQET